MLSEPRKSDRYSGRSAPIDRAVSRLRKIFTVFFLSFFLPLSDDGVTVELPDYWQATLLPEVFQECVSRLSFRQF